MTPSKAQIFELLYRIWFRYQIQGILLFLSPILLFYFHFDYFAKYESSEYMRALYPRMTCDLFFLKTRLSESAFTYQSSVIGSMLLSALLSIVTLITITVNPHAATKYGIREGFREKNTHARIIGILLFLLLSSYMILTFFSNQSGNIANCSWFKTETNFTINEIYSTLALVGLLVSGMYACAHISALIAADFIQRKLANRDHRGFDK